MYKVGIFPGKFTPPHRGHLNAIIHASTQCDRLYVIVSDHPDITKKLCEESKLPYMSLKLRAKWLSQELQDFGFIKIIMLDESGIQLSPYDWREWFARLDKVVPEEFNVIFGGEPQYKDINDTYCPNVEYILYDSSRLNFSISGTQIRKNPLEHWDMLLGSTKSFFAKRILITGTESCGKTTITNYLARLYNTFCSTEYGRYYSEECLGGNEAVFQVEDFGIIAYEQYKRDMSVLNKANKIVFFDTDAVVTQYYSQLYIGTKSDVVETFINPDRYDLVLLYTPDVKWIDDGLRWNKKDETRWMLHDQLKEMYMEYGFKEKIIEISGNYQERLLRSIEIIDHQITYRES